MNPYEVLNVATNASDHEIKAAYRRAVKKYHPDVSYGDDVETIVIINQAYELLSDPQRRNAFDAGLGWIIQEPVEEDPREVYKREYLRRKREEAQNRIARDRKVFRYFYKINVVIAVLAFVFVVDELLPSLVRNEIVIREWILTRRVKGSTYNIRYFQTNNFTFAKPNGIALNYDYDKPEPMRIEVSPIIRIPTKV